MRMLKKESWPYRIVINDDEHSNNIEQVERWLGEHVGAFRQRWNAVYLFDETHFYFVSDQDAVMFALRWA